MSAFIPYGRQNIEQTDVDAVVETRNPRHVEEIIAALEADGFPTRRLSAHSGETPAD